jgi:DNA-directed RNA polymerase specialized sigma24 family protein
MEEEGGYTDEFGFISAEVRTVLNDLLPAARGYALSTLQDREEGDRLLRKAAALVTRILKEPSVKINDLRAYLYQAFRRLALDEFQRERLHEQLNQRSLIPPESQFDEEAEKLGRKILIEQLMRRMDEWTREVYEHLLLGYTLKEIAAMKGEKDNYLRNKFSRRLRELTAEIGEESRAAEKESKKRRRKFRFRLF